MVCGYPGSVVVSVSGARTQFGVAVVWSHRGGTAGPYAPGTPDGVANANKPGHRLERAPAFGVVSRLRQPATGWAAAGKLAWLSRHKLSMLRRWGR